MRNGLVGRASVAALAWMLVASSCGGGGGGSNPGSGGTTSSGGSSGGTSSSGGSSGGTSSSGGKGGSGGVTPSGGSGGTTTSPPSCPNGTSCGGTLVGTWKVDTSCLSLSGDMDGFLLYLGCPKVPVTGSLKVTGTWTAKDNGTFVDNTVTNGSITFPLSSACLTVSSTPVECPKISSVFTAAGWSTATCELDAQKQCNCTATATDTRGLGLVSPFALDTGTYKTSGGTFTLEDQPQPYTYCISGDTLTVTPKSDVLPLSGTVVLKKSVVPGTGGAAGGTSGSGGRKTGAGGTSGGTGGATRGTGGTTTAAGGVIGSGGRGGGAGGATPGTGGVVSAGGSTGQKGPCDIYGAANAKCVAAHSTVRALFSSYTGKLYQIKRASDSKTQDIMATAGGFADSAPQETFCQGTTCVITFVYDQSGNGNDVEAETADSKVGGNKGQSASNANQEPFNVSGHKVYSLYLKQSQAYWKDGSKSNVPLGATPQTVYMVTSGKHYGSGCCFDYGNGPLSRSVSGCGTMDAVNFSSNTMWEKGAGAGPWVMADFECGLKAGANPNNNVPSMAYAYVTAIEKNNGTSEYALKGADATTATKLGTFYKGKLPFKQAKEGAIILGSGGDCCYSNTTLSQGTFYEGAIVAGYPADEIDDAVQANIVAAQYGK
jgi:non-reducing end alpha-L-arabinofuranosidase